MQMCDNQFLENVFKNLRQKVNLYENAEILSEKKNVIVLRIIDVNNDESISSSWAKLR